MKYLARGMIYRCRRRQRRDTGTCPENGSLNNAFVKGLLPFLALYTSEAKRAVCDRENYVLFYL